MLCFTLSLLRFIDLLLYFTHPLVYQSLNMFRIILLRGNCSVSIARLLDSTHSSLPRIFVTYRVTF
jgi:hypothetical protein